MWSCHMTWQQRQLDTKPTWALVQLPLLAFQQIPPLAKESSQRHQPCLFTLFFLHLISYLFPASA